jgi:hypothetical protein
METPKNTHAASAKDRIVDGCRRLASQQAAGQCFTVSEIGRACGVTDRAITFIERRAQYRFAKRLHQLCPNLVEEMFRGRPIKEIFGALNPDPYCTGKPAVRPRTAKQPAPRKDKGTMSLTKLSRELGRRTSHRQWKTKGAPTLGEAA